MSASRKGLKRYGQRSYIVSGSAGAWIIERDRPYRFFVKDARFPYSYGDFFCMVFRRLRDARAYAESLAGIDFYPYPEVPKFLRHWKPERRV